VVPYTILVDATKQNIHSDIRGILFQARGQEEIFGWGEREISLGTRIG
jgi:hypothetical protein